MIPDQAGTTYSHLGEGLNFTSPPDPLSIAMERGRKTGEFGAKLAKYEKRRDVKLYGEGRKGMVG
jgi:hypothetical protein